MVDAAASKMPTLGRVSPCVRAGGGEARRKGVGGCWWWVVEEEEATTKRRARAGERRRGSCGVAGRIAWMDVDRRSCGVGAEDVPRSERVSLTVGRSFEVKAARKGPVSGEGVKVGMLEGKVDSSSSSTVVWSRAGCSLKLDRDRGPTQGGGEEQTKGTSRQGCRASASCCARCTEGGFGRHTNAVR